MTPDNKLIPNDIVNKMAVKEVTDCNVITGRYGLVLSADDARELVETRAEALLNNGRVEFSGGILNKIILEFCDSPFLSQFNYAATLNELVDTFYYYKNETLDEIGDDELIALMKKYFDQSCQGSIELLQTRELEKLAHNIRFGIVDYSILGEDIQQPFDQAVPATEAEEEHHEWY